MQFDALRSNITRRLLGLIDMAKRIKQGLVNIHTLTDSEVKLAGIILY